MKITLDAGHRNNVNDFGAVGNGRKESECALDIVKFLDKKIKENGIETALTRNSENDTISIDSRWKKAINSKSDWLISIHLNAFSDPQANGFEVCYKNHADKAKMICDKICKETGLTNRGAKLRNDLGVLNGFKNSLLIECGFITNKSDLSIAMSDSFKNALFDAIMSALGLEAQEVVTKSKIEINGKIIEIETIVKDGQNFVKLRDLATEKLIVGYDSAKKMPVISTL